MWNLLSVGAKCPATQLRKECHFAWADNARPTATLLVVLRLELVADANARAVVGAIIDQPTLLLPFILDQL